MSTSPIGRLLIVDDEVELMTALCEMLTKQGYNAAGCTSATDALATLKEQEFDLLLADLMMPEMDGIALLRSALEIDPHLVGVIMTGHGTVQTAVEAMKVGAFDYVLKPFKLNALLPVLARAIQFRHLQMENLQLRETVAIYELTQAIALTLDTHTVLHKVADTALQQCQADEVSIMLPSEDGTELYVGVVRGDNRERILGKRVPIEEGIAGWVARNREPVTLQGPVSDPRFAPVYPRDAIRSSISMPMLVGNKLVGVLNVNAVKPRRPFTLGQVKALSILANVAASAVESARLYGKATAAEEKYRSIFEKAVEGIFQAGCDGRYVTANPAMAQILGYISPEELIASVTDLGREIYVDPGRHAELWRAIEERGVVLGFESRVRRKDGALRWTREHARCLRDPAGGCVGYESIVEDISEQKRAEELLRDSERRFQTLETVSPVGIFRTDRDGACVYVNQRWCEIAGITSREALGSGWSQTLHPDDRDRVVEEWRRCASQNTRFKSEYRFVGPSGVTIWVLGQAVAETSDTGETVGYVGTLTDTTEQKLAEQVVRESEHQHRIVLKNIDEIVYMVRITPDNPLQGRVQFVSGRVKSILGYEPREFVDDPGLWFRILHPDDVAGVVKTTQGIMADRQPATRSYRIRHKQTGEYRWMEDKVVVRAEDDGSSLTQFGVARDVTERTRAEETLTKLSSAVEQAADNVLISDKDGLIEFVNPAFERLTGYSAAEVLGQTPRVLKSGKHPARFYEEIWNTILGGRVFRAEFINRKKNGELYHEEKAIAPIRDRQGNITHFISTGRDVSERKRAEETLKESESRFRVLAEATASAIFIYQGDKFLYTNPAAETLTGYSQEELCQIRFWDLVHPDYRELIKQRGLARQRGETLPQNYDLKLITKSGEERWTDVSAAAIKLKGEPAGIATAFDITERKRAEEALRTSEERYRELFENANDIIYTNDLEGNFTSLNKAGERITGYSRDETLRMNFADVLAPEHLGVAQQMLGQKLGDSGPTTYEVEIVAKDGRRVPLEVSTRLIYQGGEVVGVQGIARDLTLRRSLEDQLRQSQKMEAIGRLAGGVAHDFNNLLTAIIGYGQLAMTRIGESEPLRRDLEEIRNASSRAAQLTKQLLAFSRQQILQPKVLDLNAVVASTSKMLKRLIGEDIDLLTDLDACLGSVRADPTQIEQVILNLAINARDAMPQGGKLTIETANVDVSEEYARSHLAIEPGLCVMLAMTDTGCGMDAETQSHVFEPFFTTKEQGKGTGLGLATVYGIVTQSGGYIRVYSEPGLGSTFKVYLPRVQAPPDAVLEVERFDLIPKGAETVLLVEDEAQVRELASAILRQQGYTVLEASNGDEGIRIAKEHQGVIHLVLTDVVMPGMSGKELANRIEAMMPGIKVLFASGYTDDAIVHHGVLDPGTAFLQKPFTPSSLARKVREVLDGPRRS